MEKVLLLSLFGVISSKIVLHEKFGLSLEEKENLFIHRKKPVETNVLVPFSVHVPDGPFQGESMARMQTEFGKVLEDEGLKYYHVNNTEEVYTCDQVQEFKCQESWYKAGNGKSKTFFFADFF